MNSLITTLEPPSPSALTKNILSKDGFNCSLIELAPGNQTKIADPSSLEEHILFVLDGVVTVRLGEINTILSKDEALLLPRGSEHSITAHASNAARLLRVEIPPRQIITPPLVAFES